ncbi:MAG: hypothetical protein EOM87_02745 [Clostridia bacterium]|nr:hypothetical protein [Clostridia bacterium]
MIIINGTLKDKELSLENISANQGEAGNVTLTVALTPQPEITYYFEFMCPYGRIYLSQALTVEDSAINYAVPSCVMLVAGKVYVQLIGRSEEGIVLKSIKNASASFEVLPSINGVGHIENHSDFLSEAERTLALTREAAQNAIQQAAQAAQAAAELNDLLNTVLQKLNNKELEGKNAYAYAQEGGYTGSETEFCSALARMGYILEDAPQEGRFIRENGNWVAVANLPNPSIADIGSVLKVAEAQGDVHYVLSPNDYETALLDADSATLENQARNNSNVNFYGSRISSTDKDIDNKQGNFALRFAFEGAISLQYIEDKINGLIYKRSKIGDSGWSAITVELTKTLKTENIEISPSDFAREEFYYVARINLNNLLGFNISDSTVPLLLLSKTSQMTAYECDLKKELELINGALVVKAAKAPSQPFSGDLVLMGIK